MGIITKEDIKNFRAKNNLTQSDFAKVLSVSLQTVQNWEAGRKIPSTKIYKISDLIENGIPKKEEVTNGEITDSKYYKMIKVPFIGAKGYASFSGHSDSNSFNFVDEPYLHYFTDKQPHKNDVVIEVFGDSMLPYLKDSSKVLATTINQADWGYAPTGVYGIAFRNQFVIKRIKKNTLFEDKRIELFSDNELHGSIVVYADDIKAMFQIKEIISQKVN